MKVFSKLVLLMAVSALIFSSCSNTVTYAEQLNSEKELIADYIARNNIKVVSDFPTTYPWPDNVYVKTSSGLYFHLVNQGDTVGNDSIEQEDLVVPRFIQYTLDAVADTTYNWNTIDFPYPTTFNYGDATQACTGWQEAVSYMLYNNSEAKFIVPSKIGFSDATNSVTPYAYDFKMKFQH